VRQITGTVLSTGALYRAPAWGDGEHDDQPILQAAWGACGLISVPAGNYRIDSPLMGPFVDNAGIIGVGAGLKAAATPAGAGTIITARDTIQAMLQSNIQ
jgi:hypothetical protein